ncbi:hypothetical protein C1645_739093 [Glomus cerebriforme]|uniref:TRP C-terminal domain-containing protein n=1 Tax=Glomus cerebriforme TaxID=658196 RepID=A0A397SXX5_9GLOM|nr:hypothetical protein C1645_739093 [Glomus cerebriforme]
MFFFIILIVFSFPFVSAQVSADYTQEAFSGYIDVLINFIVPFIVFVIVDYDNDENGSKPLACLARIFAFLINIGLQQELAFIFSPIKIPNFIKILQHIVICLIGFLFIGNCIIFFNIYKIKITESDPFDELEENQTEEDFATKLQTFETNFQILEARLNFLEQKVTPLPNKIEVEENQTRPISSFYKSAETVIFAPGSNIIKRLKILGKVNPKKEKHLKKLACIIFLNLSALLALLVSAWIAIMYKTILNDENEKGKEGNGKERKEKRREDNESEYGKDKNRML